MDCVVSVTCLPTLKTGSTKTENKRTQVLEDFRKHASWKKHQQYDRSADGALAVARFATYVAIKLARWSNAWRTKQSIYKDSRASRGLRSAAI